MKRSLLLETEGALDPPPGGTEWAVAGAIAVAVSIGFCIPLYSTWSNWGIRDWDVHLLLQAVPYFTVRDYGELPLWNPYTCGGTVMLANPQSRLLSPFFPLHLVFGFLAGIKLEIIAHLALGLLGAYALGREVLRSRIGSATAAAVFMLNATYAHTLAVGMTPFLCVAYVPWVVLGFVKSETRPIFLWLTGSGLACMFFEGGAYLVSITLFGLGAFAAAESLQRRRANAALRLLESVALMLGLGAVKFFPSIAFMHLFPRKMNDYSGYSVTSLFSSLFSRESTETLVGGGEDARSFWRGMSYGFDENDMYVGLLAGALFVVGAWSKHERRPAWLALLLATSWVAFGDRVRPSLWHFIHRLPIYDSMRVAQRFHVMMLLGLSVFCGLGATALIHELRARFGSPPARWLGWGLVLLVAGDLISASYSLLGRAFVVAPLLPGRLPEPFKQHVGDPRAMLAAALRNVGTIDCYEAVEIPQNAHAAEWEGYRGETYLLGTGGTVETTSWSPNRLRLDVAADGPGWAVVNQQGYPGWKVEQGNRVVPTICDKLGCHGRVDGLLAIEVPRGRSVLDVYYRPTSVVLGAATTALFLCGFGVSLWASLGRSRRRFSTFPDGV